MKEVFIITSGEIIFGKTAGARRILKIARSLAEGGIRVYLCSFADLKRYKLNPHEVYPGVITISGNIESDYGRPGLFDYLKTVDGIMAGSESDKVVFLYPSTFVFKDFIYLLYFKFLKRYRFFCEINELRTAIAFSSSPGKGLRSVLKYFLKSVRDYTVFRISEFQVVLYDGITVISGSLEKHFSRYSRNILRLPILCDSSDISTTGHPPTYDGTVFRLCFAGYIKMDKEGFDLLLDALHRIRPSKGIELFLYGILEDDDRHRLTVSAQKYGLSDRVHYLGNLDPDLLKNELQKYHLLILPRPLNKRTAYGFSTKLTEYLVSGVPVLVTDVSDNALYIKDGYNGYIVSPGSVEIMTARLEQIMMVYNSEVRNIVDNAYRTVREQLDYRLFTNQLKQFLFGTEAIQPD
jgi:glycosyltransferase involved in cell wall biosynthesis